MSHMSTAGEPPTTSTTSRRYASYDAQAEGSETMAGPGFGIHE